MEEALHLQLKHRASGNCNDQINPDQIEGFVEDDDSRYKQIGRAANSKGEGSWRILLSEFPRLDQPAASSRAAKKCFGKSRVDQYYHQQEDLLQTFTQLDSITDEPTTTEASTEASRAHIAKRERIAINISNATNLVLFAAKVVASIESKSLAIIASTMDSLLDLLSGFILWFASVSMRHPNPYRYPIGKKRMQPLGIIVFSSIMATLGLLILLESIRQLISKDHALALKGPQGMWVIGIMVAVTVIKLILMFYCRMYKDEIVRAYAQDHLFDVITNSIGLVAAFLASKFYWWIDPLGAILLALFTIRTWSVTVLENVKSLVGKSASPDFLQKLTYLCWNHHEDIKQIDTVKAYNFGSSYFAEIDIVLSAEMPLREAHDIGESLQNKLEKLPEIERAFVHLDYECSHKPEHACIDAS